MSDGVLIAIISSSGALLLAVWATIDRLLQRRQDRKTGRKEQLDRIEQNQDKHDKRLERLEKRSDLQYISLLRLTVMDSDMPMSERLIAGQEYLDMGGNGDVRHFYEHLKAQVNGKDKEADSA